MHRFETLRSWRNIARRNFARRNFARRNFARRNFARRRFWQLPAEGCSSLLRLVVICAAAVLCTGCQTAERSALRAGISDSLTCRFGIESGSQACPGAALLPPGAATEDGLTEDEAVSIALWNNAAYQELLTELDLSSARLLDAGLIADPQFMIFFPLGPKELEFTTYQAINDLWLRKLRVRAAELDLDRVSQTMVQNGLNLIRDVRVAHANLVQAQQQAELAQEAQSLREEIAALAQKRLAAGDISELEATTSQIDALQAQAAAGRASQDVELARQRLRALLGLTMHSDPMVALSDSVAPVEQQSEELVRTALSMRPDLRAAQVGIEFAAERAGLAEWQFMNLDAIYDANGSGKKGFESGPGLRFTIPIFNRNQGGIAMADAQLQQAVQRYVTVRDQVTLNVRTASTQLAQAEQNRELLRTQILPALVKAQELARRNYELGGTPYFLVLQTMSQYLDARIRELQLEADVRRALAELERGVGMRLAQEQRVEQAAQPNETPAATATAGMTSASVQSATSATAQSARRVTAGWRATHPEERGPNAKIDSDREVTR